MISLLFPSRCTICGRRLGKGEKEICTSCYFELPVFESNDERCDEQLMEYFHELIDLGNAKAFMEYHPDNAGAQMLMTLKYGRHRKLGLRLGELMAGAWKDCAFFNEIDLIVPVPLARERELKRGYNQSALIAEGIAKATGLPLNTSGVVRSISNPTQTSVADHERQKNVEDIFTLLSPKDFAGRHVLLVDDVITTGATLKSLAKEIAKAGNVRFSFAAAAKTKKILGRR